MSEALVDALAAFRPATGALFGDHFTDYDHQVVPYLFMSDVCRWATKQYLEGDKATVAELLSMLERHFAEGDENVREFIAVGFVELMPSSYEPAGGMRALLGPLLLKEFGMVNR